MNLFLLILFIIIARVIGELRNYSVFLPFFTLITSPEVIVAGALNFKMDATCFVTVSEEVIYAK